MDAKAEELRAAKSPTDPQAPAGGIPREQRIAGLVLRAIFIAAMMAVTVRVASPQNETIWSVYETPGDLVRLILGLIIGLWVLYLLVVPPRDPEGYRTWLFLGLAAVPFALICVVAVWWPH